MEDYILYKIVEIEGCEFEDGSDTRNVKTKFELVKQEDNEKFNEAMISNYESQDYSYQFDCQKVCAFNWYEIKALAKALNKAYEEQRR